MSQDPPKLLADRSFWGLTVAQFLGAFNDNLFKQLMLLMAIPVAVSAGSAASSATMKDQQGLATVIFALPYVLLSPLAGYLADKLSKRRIIVFSKFLEIQVMAAGVGGFLAYQYSGYFGLLVVLFFMGLQSTLFGPGKYGILPEILREEDLPRANGIILMTTFVAIILGTAIAGILKTWVEESAAADATKIQSGMQFWQASAFCVGIAVIGTVAALFVKRVPPSQPDLQFAWSGFFIPSGAWPVLKSDKPLSLAIFASSVFWLVAGIAIQAVNSLGKVQLGLSDALTSIMTAVIAIGISVGAIAAGRLCDGQRNRSVVQWGVWGIIAFLGLLSVTIPGSGHLLGFKGSLAVLAALGVAAALFAIPVQVFIQARPPEGQKGRMIAVMNQANFVAILLAGVCYEIFDRIVTAMVWPRSSIFAMMAVLIVPVALFYRLEQESSAESKESTC